MSKAFYNLNRKTTVFNQVKQEYADMGRTYCEVCGNSDADMDIDNDICYDCLHPEEAKAIRKLEAAEYAYVFGEQSELQSLVDRLSTVSFDITYRLCYLWN